MQVLLQPGQAYDLYVRLRNNACIPVNNVKVKVFTADPTMLVASDDWHIISGAS